MAIASENQRQRLGILKLLADHVLRGAGQFLPLYVERLQAHGQLPRFVGVGRREQFVGEHGVIQPPRRIDARPNPKTDGSGVNAAQLQLRDFTQRPQTRMRCVSLMTCKAALDEHTVFGAVQRRQIGDRANGDQIKEIIRRDRQRAHSRAVRAPAIVNSASASR